MNRLRLKPIILALAGTTAVAMIGSAQAMTPPYLACIYKGQTAITIGSTVFSCWWSTVMKVDCDGNVVEVTAMDTSAPDTFCAGLFTGNFPWASDLPSIVAGNATIDTLAGSGGAIPFSVVGASLTPVAGGNAYNVDGSGGSTGYVCDGNTVNAPDYVIVTGTNNFGSAPDGDPSNATLNTVGPDHLSNLGCNEVL